MKTRKVIIDCDPGIDDSLAIMLALSMQELDVIGITIVAGNAPVEMGFQNALKVLQFMNRLDVPVFAGADRPIIREFTNALDTHGPDGLGGSMLPEVDPAKYVRREESAVDFMRKVLGGSDPAYEAVSVIALGPLTNLALLSDTDPDAFSRIDELVSMGGSFRSHGNCSPVAEYNYWCDPDAAARVYRKMDELGKPVHMVGLDVTRKIVLTPALINYLKSLDPVTGDFVGKITKFYLDFHFRWEHIVGCVINDPLAVAYFADRELCKGFDSYVQIETEGISRGQSIVDSMDFYRHPPNAVVLTEVDALSFFRLFFTRLLKLKEEPGLLRQLLKSSPYSA